MTKKKSGAAPVGGSALLTIFAVLCLTIFALLSLSTAQAGRRLSERSAQTVSACYEAEAEAGQILARLRAGQMPAGVTEQDGVYSFTCPISDTQALAVALRLEDGHYTILRWQQVSTVQWQPDDNLNLWDGRT